MSICSVCTNPTIKPEATMCRQCWLDSLPKMPLCITCGTPVKNRQASQCRNCWMAAHMQKCSRPTCQRCGKLCSWSTGRKTSAPTHCRECYSAIRLENRVVTIQAIQRNASFEDSRKRRQQRQMAEPLRAMFGGRPCALCGYNTAGVRRRIHRIVPENGYVLGNVAPLCSNCHDEIHAGVRQQPSPSVIDE